jgi:hypothetical protein
VTASFKEGLVIASNIDPKILKSTALAKATQLETRVNALILSITTDISPVTEYLAGAETTWTFNGNTNAGGTWTCPEGVTSVQVEAWGAGGGGSGGTNASGGGGAGGGEYALEATYTTVPGQVYTFTVGLPGQGGVCGGEGGYPGGDTVFDTQGFGMASGVHAHGGGGGDGTSLGAGGTGSSNTTHYDGGNGGISTSGIRSDDPSLINNLLMWWVLDDNADSNGAQIADSSGQGNYGSIVVSPFSPGGIRPTAGVTAQVPTSTTSTTTAGNAAKFVQSGSPSSWASIQANSFGLGAGVAAPADGTALTVSCWVKGNGTSNWGLGSAHGHAYTTLLANCDYPLGLSGSYTNTNASGFALYLQDGKPGFYLNNAGEVVHGVVLDSSALPSTGWHMITGTWDGTTMTLYVDGSSVGTPATPAFTPNGFSQGHYPATVGINPATLSDSPFNATISNVWLAAGMPPSGYISEAVGASSALGGSGGGASGGSLGVGAAGASATGSSGAARGASAGGSDSIHGGSDAGGDGGNNDTNGNSAVAGPPGGGGGGGAGATASPAAVTTFTVVAQESASYCGIDSTHVPPGFLYDVSSAPQAGGPNPYPAAALVSPSMYVGGTPASAFNGSMNAVALLPYMKPALTGQVVNTITMSITVQSTNASVLPLRWADASAIPPSLGSNSDITNYLPTLLPTLSLVEEYYIPAGVAGRRISIDVTNDGLATACANHPTALVFGGFQGSSSDIGFGSYSDPSSFAWNTVFNGAASPDPNDDLALTFEIWPISGGNTTGGDGAPGTLTLTYPDPRYYPVASMRAEAFTDANGNQLPAGIATDTLVAFDPTITTIHPPSVVRIPETWKQLGALSGSSGLSVMKARYRYSPDNGGQLIVQVETQSNVGIVGGVYTFANLLSSVYRPSVNTNANLDKLPAAMGMFGQPSAPTGSYLSPTLLVNGQNATTPGQVAIALPTVATGSVIIVGVTAVFPLT